MIIHNLWIMLYKQYKQHLCVINSSIVVYVNVYFCDKSLAMFEYTENTNNSPCVNPFQWKKQNVHRQTKKENS